MNTTLEELNFNIKHELKGRTILEHLKDNGLDSVVEHIEDLENSWKDDVTKYLHLDKDLNTVETKLEIESMHYDETLDSIEYHIRSLEADDLTQSEAIDCLKAIYKRGINRW